MNKNNLYSNEIQNSIYLGWRGFGSLLGTRYYLNTQDDVIKIISNSPFKGMEFQAFPASEILCVELQKSSLFYAMAGALLTFLKQLPNLIKDSSEVLKVSGLGGLAIELLTAFVIAVIVGFVIERLYERPYIEFLLEGGAKLRAYTNFHSKLPEIIQGIEKARVNKSLESISSSHNYFKYQVRALPDEVQKKDNTRIWIGFAIAFVILFVLLKKDETKHLQSGAVAASNAEIDAILAKKHSQLGKNQVQ